jgi:hypothetical protein
MQLLNSESKKQWEHNYEKDFKFMKSIIERMVIIGELDKKLNYESDFDAQINILQEKINKQKLILEKSKDLEEKINKKIEELDVENSNRKISLLESLGTKL